MQIASLSSVPSQVSAQVCSSPQECHYDRKQEQGQRGRAVLGRTYILSSQATLASARGQEPLWFTVTVTVTA